MQPFLSLRHMSLLPQVHLKETLLQVRLILHLLNNQIHDIGFPEFLPFEETGLALTEEETNDRETFGYWCRDVRGSEDCADIQRKI